MAIKFDTFRNAAAGAGGLNYKGPYNATTNSPVLTSSLKDDYYKVDGAGTLAGVTLNINDIILFNQNASSPITSAMFDKFDNTDQITSVNTQTGPAVVLDTDDVSEGSSNLYFTSPRFTSELATKDTSNLTEGTNLYYTNARFDTQLATKDSDNVSEGSSNLYYTNARFDTQLATKSTTNVAEGTNLYYTNARFDTQLATKDTDNVSEGSSNLYYTNARFDTQLATKDTSNLTEGTNLYHTNARVDARIALANANDLNDVSYTAGVGINGQVLTYVHANNRWEAAAASGGGISSVNGDTGPTVVLDSDDVSEGSSNLYYTNARFDTQLATKSTTNVAEGTNLYYTNARFDTQLATKDSDDVAEGSSNLYYTNARFDTQLATKSTTNVAEGTNLYHTNARVDARIALANANDLNDVSYTAGAPIDGQVLTYVHANNRWEAAAASGGGISSVNGDTGPTVVLDSDDVSEGSSNLYYTNARFDTQLATKSTTNVAEGTNLYHTNARVDARIALANANDLNDVSYTAGAPIDGQVLTYVHANNQWEAAAASGGGGLTYQARTTASHSPLTPAADYHYSINADSATFVVNLPALSSLTDGQQIRFKLQARGNAAYDVTINRAGSDTIDGATSQTLSVTYSSITLVVGSTEWEIV